MAQYTTLLPHQIELDGNWEVGLVELFYPVSWYNVGEGEYFAVACETVTDGPIITTRYEELSKTTTELIPIRGPPVIEDVREGPFYITEGHYSSAQDLLNNMKQVWMEYWQKQKIDRSYEPRLDSNSLSFRFNERTHKAVLKTAHPKHWIELSPNLADILAMKSTGRENRLESQTEIDVNRAKHTFFVYCDIIEDSIVGDVRAPLLRATVARGSYGDNIRDIYIKPLYHPVRTNRFDTISISITTESGDLVPFNFGSSCVTLHFRQIAKPIVF